MISTPSLIMCNTTCLCAHRELSGTGGSSEAPWNEHPVLGHTQVATEQTELLWDLWKARPGKLNPPTSFLTSPFPLSLLQPKGLKKPMTSTLFPAHTGARAQLVVWLQLLRVTPRSQTLSLLCSLGHRGWSRPQCQSCNRKPQSLQVWLWLCFFPS